MNSRFNSMAGPIAGFTASFFWGMLPLFWRQLNDVPSLEILCWRVVCSLVFVIPTIWLTRRWDEVLAVLHERRTLLTLMCSMCFIAFNWFLYIYCVTHSRVLDSSLGYFINPLVNVLFGIVFFRERLTRLQGASIVLAALGVAWSAVQLGYFPYYSIALAVSFAIYSVLRKTVHVESLPGLFWETILLTPAAICLLGWWWAHGTGYLSSPDLTTGILLLLAGPCTSIPLLLFAYGARHMNLIPLGLVQYISPTGQFFIGVYFGEPLHGATLVTFCCIWAGLILYTMENIRLHRMAMRHTEKRKLLHGSSE